MLTSKTSTDPGSGRVVIREHDDRGEPENWISPTIADCRGQGAFNTVLTVPMTRDDTAKRGALRIGTLILTAQVVPAAGPDYVALEVQVVASIAGAPTVIYATAFGSSGADTATVPLDDTTSYDSLQIQARQNVNGTPSGDATQVIALSLQASGRFTR